MTIAFFLLGILLSQTAAKKDARTNFASKTTGAKLLFTSRPLTSASAILSDRSDKYLAFPCSSEPFYIDIGLSEEILLSDVELSNLELYSSHLRRFKLLTSMEYPATEWQFGGVFENSGAHSAHAIQPVWT
jgi:hypothetical protein